MRKTFQSSAASAVLLTSAVVSVTTPHAASVPDAPSFSKTGYELPSPQGDKQSPKTVNQLETQKFSVLDGTKATSFKVSSPSFVGYCVAAGSHKGSSHHQCFGKIWDTVAKRWVVCSIPYLEYMATELHMTSGTMKSLIRGGSVIVRSLNNYYLPKANTAYKAGQLGWAVYTQAAGRYRLDMKTYARELPKGVASGGNAEVTWVKGHHGPWRASDITWKSARIAQGGTNVGHFTLKSSVGKPMVGIRPKVTCKSGTNLVSVSKTNAQGVGTVKAGNKDETVKHTCDYVALLASATHSLTGSPSGFQQVTGAPVYDHVRGSGSFGNLQVKITTKNACATGCDAIAHAHIVEIVPVGGGRNHVRYYFDGTIGAGCFGHGGQQCVVDKNVPDDTTLTGYDICPVDSNNKCTSPYVFHVLHVVFFCPGHPEMDQQDHKDCNYIGFIIPAPTSPAGSKHVWTAYEVIDHNRVAGSTVTLTNGSPTKLPKMTITKGHTYHYVVTTTDQGHTYTWDQNALDFWSAAVPSVS